MIADSYSTCQELAETYTLGMETALSGRYETLVHALSRAVVDCAWCQECGHEDHDIKTRRFASVAAMTAIDGHTHPQLKVNIAAARKASATQREFGEVIWQMALYGGSTAAINELSAALKVFAEENERE